MARGDEDIEGGGLEKFLDTQNGGSEKIRGAPKICILQNQWERGAPKKIEPLARGAAKISSFAFQYLHPPPPPLVILNVHVLSLIFGFFCGVGGERVVNLHSFSYPFKMCDYYLIVYCR